MLKYVFINMTTFIKKEYLIFILMVLAIMCSVITVLFSFGFYHHLQQKKLDEQFGENELVISFEEYPGKVTKGDMLQVVCDIDKDVLDNCYIDFNGHFPDEHSDDEAIDHSMLWVPMTFAVDNGKITVATAAAKSLEENDIIKDGNYFTAQQVEDGDLVCIAPDWGVNEVDGYKEAEIWAKKYAPLPNGNYLIDGKEYKCIGHAEWISVIPVVPITTIDDDCYLQDVIFTFYKPITRHEYSVIAKAIRERYDDMADIPEMHIQEINSTKFYNSLLVLCVILVLLSGVVVSFLYQYILLQRSYMMTVYRLCGMSVSKVRLISFMECLVLSFLLCLLSIIIFNYMILPYMQRYFEYMQQSYTLLTYISLGLIYIVTSSIVLIYTVRRYIHDNIVIGLGGV